MTFEFIVDIDGNGVQVTDGIINYRKKLCINNNINRCSEKHSQHRQVYLLIAWITFLAGILECTKNIWKKLFNTFWQHFLELIFFNHLLLLLVYYCHLYRNTVEMFGIIKPTKYIGFNQNLEVFLELVIRHWLTKTPSQMI